MRAAVIPLVVLSALVASPLARVRAAERPVQPFELTLETAPLEPRPGQRVYWLGRLRNATSTPVQVPKRIAEWLHFVGHHRSPGELGAFGHGVAHAKVVDVEWMRLDPGESIEVGGDVGDAVPDCRRGCPEGSLELSFEVSVPPSVSRENLPPGRFVPDVPAVATTVRIEGPRHAALARASASAVSLEIRGARQLQGAVQVSVSIVNRTDAPLRVPVLAWLEPLCDLEGDEAIGAVYASIGGEDPVWTEAESKLLAPGRALDGVVKCTGQRLPREGTLRLTLSQKGRFVASRPLEPPFVWAGDVTSDAVPVRRR